MRRQTTPHTLVARESGALGAGGGSTPSLVRGRCAWQPRCQHLFHAREPGRADRSGARLTDAALRVRHPHARHWRQRLGASVAVPPTATHRALAFTLLPGWPTIQLQTFKLVLLWLLIENPVCILLFLLSVKNIVNKKTKIFGFYYLFWFKLGYFSFTLWLKNMYFIICYSIVIS